MWQRLAGRLAHRLSATFGDARPAAPPDGRRLIFVGGAPRSGTTLLQHILDSHPEVFGGPEFDCVPTIAAAWRQVVLAWEHGRITVFCTRSGIDAAFGRMLEELLLPVADASGARLLSEKTPFNVLAFADLLEMMPGCRAIHIVRDPRAVIASLLNVGVRAQAKNAHAPPSTLDIQAAIALIREALAAGSKAQERFPQRLLTCTYEALVLQPRPALERLCAFLDLAFHPAMLEPHAKKHPGQDDIARLDNGTWLDPRRGYRPIEASRINAWQTDLDAAQIAAVNDAFREHPALRALGYSFE